MHYVVHVGLSYPPGSASFPETWAVSVPALGMLYSCSYWQSTPLGVEVALTDWAEPHANVLMTV